jgi:hypothetical protein
MSTKSWLIKSGNVFLSLVAVEEKDLSSITPLPSSRLVCVHVDGACQMACNLVRPEELRASRILQFLLFLDTVTHKDSSL